LGRVDAPDEHVAHRPGADCACGADLGGSPTWASNARIRCMTCPRSRSRCSSTTCTGSGAVVGASMSPRCPATRPSFLVLKIVGVAAGHSPCRDVRRDDQHAAGPEADQRRLNRTAQVPRPLMTEFTASNSTWTARRSGPSIRTIWAGRHPRGGGRSWRACATSGTATRYRRSCRDNATSEP
jgi:hypothetical protein